MEKGELIKILRRLYEENIKKYLKVIFLALFLSVIVAVSTSSTAWLLDPAVKKIFLDKDNNLAILIPLINRFAILVARRVYREIGNNILRKKDLENYNKSGKIFVNKIGKIKQTIFSIFDLFILIFSKSYIHLTNEEHMEIGKEINLNERF